ncbi:hypothetical protein ACFQMA_07070 [Halosimplex aquaticum]|uniref:Membrane protein involved in the export of O-antigen and teichoic acid n=1 Tax=Halosimplex aquaticum TaxID=3026162 RepID=A0ABD5XWV0_9EURY|nr:hypothetical protein [Halosimplex aquaticum]
MSGDSARYSWLPAEAERDRLAGLGATLTRVLFGGRPGLALFCGSLALFVLTWRVGVFFNDIGLFVPMLERMSEGHLSFGRMGELDYGYPGMHYHDGLVYGRGYGVVGLALPVLWGLELLDPLVDLRWLVVVGWSGLALATCALVGDQIGRRRRGLAVGAGLAAVALIGNAWFHKPFQSDLIIMALQLSTMFAGAAIVVAVYRLLADRHGETVGLLGGATVLLGTPVAFWATTPKRHTLTAMFVVLALYAFARSRRDGESVRNAARFRGGAYACAGLLAWVHAPEGFTLFAAIAAVDIPTARRNDARTLAVVGGMFALSLVPFLVTNALISGNPALPPHFLDAYHGQSPADVGVGGVNGDGGGGIGRGGSTGGVASDGFWPVAVLWTVVGAVLGKFDAISPLLQRAASMYVNGFVTLFTDPDDIVEIGIRWGQNNHETSNIFFDGGTNLSLVESAPVIAALIALPLRRRIGELRAGTVRLRDAVDPVDLVVVVFAGLLTCLYMNRLPVHAMVTVRYLHPLYPLAVYALFRIPRVRSILRTRTRTAVLGYEAAVLFGAPIAFGSLLVFETAKGQVVQQFGVASLVVATVLAVALLLSRRDDRAETVAAGAFGAAVGLATVYLLLTAFVLMHYGPSALPAVDALAGEFRWWTLTMPEG